MKASEKKPQELIGIVISGLPRTTQKTVFSAYVWGPAPLPDDKDAKTA